MIHYVTEWEGGTEREREKEVQRERKREIGTEREREIGTERERERRSNIEKYPPSTKNLKYTKLIVLTYKVTQIFEQTNKQTNIHILKSTWENT